MDKMQSIKSHSLYLGPLLALLLYGGLLLDDWPQAAAITAAVTALCALWWILEPIPIPATSIIPLALFPLLGILDKHQVAASYGNSLILLLLGGFILSSALERCGAHRRIALGLLHLIGGNSSRRIVVAFMCTAALLSMWVSNTATTLMLLPIAMAITQSADDQSLMIPLLLGICYAASLGGIGTPIGTPPNIIFMQVYQEYTGNALGFVQWMLWAVPVIIVFLPLMAWWLTRGLQTRQQIVLPAVGEWSIAERRVLLVFAVTAIAWVTRTEPFGGWAGLFDLKKTNDAAVALLAVVMMFIIPDGKQGRLLDWETANRIPWGMLLLFAGGIAIAKAFSASGLATMLADQLSSLASFPVFLMILIICLAVTFITEVTSNTATTTLLMPILAVAALAANVEPALMMVPAAMSASCAFMLPVATAPNAIMFSTGKIPIQQMVKTGVMLNLIGSFVIATTVLLLIA